MTKRDYLNNLLKLCTERQKAFFQKMYKEGPDNSQLDTAIWQVENTLKNLNHTKEEVSGLVEKNKELEAAKDSEIKNVNDELAQTKANLEEANRLIRMLRNPILLNNVYVQEKCDLLDALQAGGVDNWEGYEAAVNGWRIKVE